MNYKKKKKKYLVETKHRQIFELHVVHTLQSV